MKHIRKTALALAAAMAISTSAFAQVYVDVPENHWAYQAIQQVTDKKWMGGNTQNQFKPNNTIDYFYFSQIAAKIAGYKDPLVDSSVSEEEKQFSQKAIDTYKNVLDSYTKSFSKWDKSSNEEIAYLLQKGVLKEADLPKFVVKQESGEESVLSLRREDMAVFVVRLMGKENEALKKTGSTGFSDDDSISSSAKPYVLYLKNAGVIQGGTNVKFNPKDKVTKAMLAKVLADALKPAGNTGTGTTAPSAEKTETSTPQKEVYLQGTVKKFYSNLYYILLQYGENKQSYYYIKKDAPIFINNKETNIETIKEGDTLLVELIEENGQQRISKITILESAKSNNTNTNTNNTNTNQQNTTSPSNTTTPSNSSQNSQGTTDLSSTKRIDGIVDFVSENGRIDIVVKYVDYKGDIKETVETYTVGQSTVITKDNKEVALSKIQKGDIIIAEVRGSTLYKAAIMEKQRKVEGTLAEKKQTNGTKIIVLENSKGEKTEYQITSETIITKKSISNAAWNDLRIGDKITLDLEYDKVIGLYAEGSFSEVKGVVQEILISTSQSKITIELSNGTTKTYPLLSGAIIKKDRGRESGTIYDVRLGQEVELALDSLEIEEMILKDQTKVRAVQGYIENINFFDDYLDLRTSDAYGSKRIQLDKDVEVFRGTRRLSRRDLEEGMLVSVTLRSYGSDQADTINILAEK
ncbi:MAG TPA: S-layer homology domain-containing protein [Epulopiscium sp.]|nr:S-layer homology domain-containing protein [Candidatus Epulonipiscium sp.]